ncbi:hypothetical protein BJ912DRAFT_965309 [Pholiota molesta]|nr:hypothetical protein BJ912DRAFT_965309 [Pholiota molesta]
MAALYERAKDIDSRSPEVIMPDGAELHETTVEYLKLVSCWRGYGGEERYSVFQQARKEVEARMVWVSDVHLDSREHLQTGSQLMLDAEDEFMNAILHVQSILDGSAPAYLIVASIPEPTSFSLRFHHEKALKEKLIFSELYEIGLEYESLPNLNDEHAEFWKSSSGDIRNEIYVKCALALEGEMVEDANHQSFTSHARVCGIFSRIIVSILLSGA